MKRSLFFVLPLMSKSIRNSSLNLRVSAPVQILFIALLLVFGMGAAASAAEFQINESAGQMKEPRIATASDGSFVVVWKNGDSDEIWARLFDASDDPVGNDFQISTGVGVYKKPNVSIAADGSFVVVWEKENSEFDFSIYARRFDASGSPLGGQFLVNTSTGELREPRIASASDGSFVVVWGKKVSGSVEEVWSRRYDASGNPLSGEFMVNSSGGKHKKPSLMIAADDSFVIVWERKISDTDILARRYDTSGNPIGGEFQLNASAGKYGKPVIGMAADGSFVVAWVNQIDDFNKDILARRFDASGNPLGGEFQINTSGGKQENPSLGVASDGSFTVVWDDKTGLDILGREYDASDNPLAGEFTVNTTTAGEQSKPDIGMNADGDFVTVWEHKDTKDIFGFRGKPLLFTDVSGSVGFDVQSSDAVTSGAGLHWADYDNDGDLDAIVTGNNFARLYLSTNEGDSFFVTNFGGGNYPRQGAMLDIDNDGDIDFWHSGETFHENNGSASFTVAGDLGFSNPVATESTAAADVNGDGYCDVLMFSSNGNWIGTHQGRVVETLVGTNDASDGLNDAGDYGSGGYCSSGDVNNDGFLDFFYHYGTGKLFLSNNGDGTYTENASGISVSTSDTQEVGSAWGDYDNDGDLDLFVPRFASGSSGYLWRNDGGTFVDVTVAAGISDTSGHRGCCWGDYDNDGDLDLYICVSSGANVLYQNQGDGTFTLVTLGADLGGTSQDAVFVDYDNDGDLDLAITQESSTNVLLQNGTDDENYLKVRLIGHGPAMTNKAAIGVRVDLYQSNGTTFIARREIGVARGLGGTEPIWVHFGGVTKTTTYVVKAHFVSGVVDTTVVPQSVSTTIGSVTILQMVTITERKPNVSVWAEVDPR